MILKSVLAAATVLAGFVAAQPAMATAITVSVTEQDNFYSAPGVTGPQNLAAITATDGGTGTVSASGTNYGAFSSFTVNGSGYPAIGSLGSPVLSAVNTAITAGTFTQTGYRKLRISITETGLTGPLDSNSIAAALNGSLSAGSILIYKAYLDPTNAGVTNASTSLFGGSNGITVDNSAGTTAEAVSFHTTALASPTGPFSFTQLFFVEENTPGSQSNFTGSVAVPEPVSLALLGAGLVGIAAIRRRKHA